MTLWQMPILALDLQDIITLVIVLGAGIASTIASQAEKKKKKAAASGSESAKVGESVPGVAVDQSSTMETLAERRREQLRELARQRRDKVAGISSEPVARPDNLSAREAIQRESARHAYAQRAESLRREGEATVVQDRARQQRDTAQARQQREAQRAKQRQEQLESLRKRYQQRQQQSGQQGARPAQRPAAQAPAPPPAPVVEQKKKIVGVIDRVIEQGEIGAAPMKQVRPVQGVKLAALTGTSLSWRDAIVFKEILDRPVSLRQSDEPQGWM